MDHPTPCDTNEPLGGTELLPRKNGPFQPLQDSSLSLKWTRMAIDDRTRCLRWFWKPSSGWLPQICTCKTVFAGAAFLCLLGILRSEEHTSELQSLMRISYAV